MEINENDLLLLVKLIAGKLQLLNAKKVDLLAIDKFDNAKYIIISTAESSQQAKNIASEITNFVNEQGFQLQKSDGEFKGDWIVLDFEKFFVHILTEQTRTKYNLEKLWKTKNNQIKF